MTPDQRNLFLVALIKYVSCAKEERDKSLAEVEALIDKFIEDEHEAAYKEGVDNTESGYYYLENS